MIEIIQFVKFDFTDSSSNCYTCSIELNSNKRKRMSTIYITSTNSIIKHSKNYTSNIVIVIFLKLKPMTKLKTEMTSHHVPKKVILKKFFGKLVGLQYVLITS